MKILLAKPRGFCAGVERAIECVEESLARFGRPIYVLHDIVHNATVCEDLRAKGAVFVTSFDEVPPGAHLLFSAHGVSPQRWEDARARGLQVIDATCPLVEKVHREAGRFARRDCYIVLVGEVGHDEVEGTLGWAGQRVRVVFSVEEVDGLDIPPDAEIAYLTQTTLSVDDCARVVEALRRKYPRIQGPPSDDICYATQNRQAAVNALAAQADLVLVVGDRESANSTRLAAICREKGIPAQLISSADAIREEWLAGVRTLLLTSGASAPESLVQGVVRYLCEREPCEVVECELRREDVHFKLPRELAPAR